LILPVSFSLKIEGIVQENRILLNSIDPFDDIFNIADAAVREALKDKFPDLNLGDSVGFESIAQMPKSYPIEK